MEQTIETKRKKQVEDKIREDGELEKLEKREKEVSERTKMTQDEKLKLESQSAGDSSKMMSDEELIKKRIKEIKDKCGKPGINDQSPLSMLYEIENTIEKYLKYFAIAREVDKNRVTKDMDKNSVMHLVMQIKTHVQTKKMEQFNKEKEEKERLENEAREAKRKNKKFIVGVKIQKPISKKPYVEKKEKKKDVISDEQKEMKKFLGQEFMEEFTLAEAAAGGAMAGAAKV